MLSHVLILLMILFTTNIFRLNCLKIARKSTQFRPYVGLSDISSDRPFTLPKGEFRPKQSLGQNFLSDQNYVMKIVNQLDTSEDEGVGNRVVELGPGPGALTRKLYERFPKMTAVEIDQRAVSFLSEKLPDLKVLHMDVLKCNWADMANERGGPLRIIGNLPFYITSQILFSLADCHTSVIQAVVTMQYEVAERIVAKPRSKSYGILSVVFQLYGKPTLDFKIPSTVFFPPPKIDAACVTIDFTQAHSELNSVHGSHLRAVVTQAFGKRRKMMRQSLKELLKIHNIPGLSEKWATKRPEELTPVDFIHLTAELFGRIDDPKHIPPKNAYVWRKKMIDGEDDRPGRELTSEL
jgi:16S rRNA (adenine1518-N6/adenine1519-N6)-dimethyltransferase